MAEFGEAFCAVVWRVNTGSEQELGKTEWDHNDLFVTAKEGDHCYFFLSLSISFFSQYFVDYSSSSASGKDAYIRKDFRSVALVINLSAQCPYLLCLSSSLTILSSEKSHYVPVHSAVP